jgi:hypothetical protein
MSANQTSQTTSQTSALMTSSSIESKVDVEMSLDDHSGKNEVVEMRGDSKFSKSEAAIGLDEDEEEDLVTLYLVDRTGAPVFYMNKRNENVKAEFKLTKKELGLSRMFFDRDSEGNPVTALQSLNEAIPISMSWATGGNPKENPYTTDDAAYAFAKCIEWMKHFNGFSIGVLGEIPGTKYRISLRASSYWMDVGMNYQPTSKLEDNMKVMEAACRGLDSRTHKYLAENVRRELVREKLLERIRELKEMPKDAFIDVKTGNKLIYDMRDKVEAESPHIKWVEKMLEETKEAEDKYFKENPPWFLTWIKEICDNATFTQLCGVMSCASYLDIKPLVSLAGGMIATILKHKVRAKIGEEINVRNARPRARP